MATEKTTVPLPLDNGWEERADILPTIRWDESSPGDSIVGRYLGKTQGIETEFGTLDIYTFAVQPHPQMAPPPAIFNADGTECKAGEYPQFAVWGTVNIRRGLTGVQPGAVVMLTSRGKRSIGGGKSVQDVSVRIKAGSNPPVLKKDVPF